MCAYIPSLWNLPPPLPPPPGHHRAPSSTSCATEQSLIKQCISVNATFSVCTLTSTLCPKSVSLFSSLHQLVCSWFGPCVCVRVCVCACVCAHVCVCVCVCVCVHSQWLSRVWSFVAPQAAACQAPLPMKFSRQEYWFGVSFPTPGDLLDPGIEPLSLASPASACRSFTNSATWEAPVRSLHSG